MAVKRTEKLNSLLQEVISEVIHRDVRNPDVSPLLSITKVNVTSDLAQATVAVSVIGTPEQQETTIKGLNKAAGFIAVNASKKVVMRHFPTLFFVIDNTVEKQMHIDNLIQKISKERDARNSPS